jgi:hypothetical protein
MMEQIGKSIYKGYTLLLERSMNFYSIDENWTNKSDVKKFYHDWLLPGLKEAYEKNNFNISELRKNCLESKDSKLEIIAEELQKDFC